MNTTTWPRTLLSVLGLAVATISVWWVWLGWDTRYNLDPVTGSVSGPYQAWQVIGCVLTLMLLAAAGGWWLSPWLVVPTMTVAFTAAWTWRAATTDDTGLWAVGAILLLLGMTIGSTAVSVGARLVRLHRAGRSDAGRGFQS